MNKYARLYEEVADRRNEVTNEEFWLYFLIVLHSYVTDDNLRVCDLEIKKLCKRHKLDYDNTCRRLIRLRTGTFAKKEPVKKVAEMKTPWLYKTRAGDWLPLVGVKETVNNTVFMEQETVNNTVSNCKKYSKTRKKTVKNTVPIPFILQTSLNNSLNNSLGGENAERGTENSKGKKSQFSTAEILQYVQKLKAGGANIPNPIAYALKIQKSNESDAFIQAALYPEQLEENPADDHLTDGLIMLLEVQAEGDDVNEYKKWYSEEDWQWLINQLAK
jgi:hypothetical protein